MFGYYLRLAALSLRRNRVLTALMIAAIGLGIGASITSLTVFHLMGGNPIAHKNDVLYVPQFDNWGPNQPYDEPNEPPNLLTYRDAMALLEAKAAGHAKRATINFTNFFPIEPENRDVKPFMATSRLTTGDFFPMFEIPFQYGGGWSAQQEADDARVIVLSKKINDQLFGGADSVGKRVRIDGQDFVVTGVVGDFLPTPKFYDVTGGPFNEPEDVYMPFRYGIQKELQSSQNNSCWKDAGEGYQAWLDSECVWMVGWVELASAADRDRFKSWMDAYVNEQKKLGRFPRPLNNRLNAVDEWLEAQRVVRRDTQVQVALSFGFLVVCLINTVGMLLAKFLGRSGEIGLRRALGASKRQVFAQYLTEAGIVGFAGGLLGLGLAWLGLQGVRQLYGEFERLSQLDLTMVLSAVGLAIVSALLAGLLPTWRACQVAPAVQLKSH